MSFGTAECRQDMAASDLEVPAPPSGQPEAAADGRMSSVSVSAPKVSIPPSAHHYCFSLDLRSLGSLSLPHPIAATLRYSYQFFGRAAPIVTNPPVELQRNTEVSLPQSYCAFDFAALPQQLQETFHRVPLVVEVWHRDTTSRDQLIGRASVQLSHLLSAEKSRFLGSAGEQSWRQTHQDRIPVVQTQRPAEKVAELSYMATLEDLGLAKAREVIVSDSSQNQLPPDSQPSVPPAAPRPAAPSLHTAPLGATPPRDTLEYRTALELELWKEEQEDLFDDQEVEYNLLEEKIQKTLCDIEKTAKQLAEAELENQRLQRELMVMEELNQMLQRVVWAKEEQNQRLRRELQAAEERNQRLRRELQDEEGRIYDGQ